MKTEIETKPYEARNLDCKLGIKYLYFNQVYP